MGARQGHDYLARIKQNGPEVWIGSERITDVTTHPTTQAAAHEIARLYDLQHQSEYRDFTLYPSPKTGELVSTQFLLPRTAEDLLIRRKMHKLWADSSCGMMGRSTDFMGAMLTGWEVSADYFEPYTDNVLRYIEYVRDNDLFLTHALTDPPADRTKPPSQQHDPYTYLGVVKETDAGIVVRGAKMLATASPYAEEVLVWSFSLRRYGPEDDAYALAFAVPTNAPGLRFISREPFGGGNAYDQPLSSRFDEMDAVAIFDDVLIPWDRVFIYKDHQKINTMYKTAMASFSGHQSTIRFLAKLQFIAGLARKGTRMMGTDQFLHVQDMIGEITTYIELTKAAIVAAEALAKPDQNGILVPDAKPIYALRNSANRWYPKVKENLQLMFAGSLLYLPASASGFDSPIAGDLHKYYRGANGTAEERIKLLKVVSNLVISGFGGRHELYERFYAGDPLLLRVAQQFNGYDWSEPEELVQKFLDGYTLEAVSR